MIPVGDRISAEYLEQQRILHADPRGYGGRGRKWAPFVLELIDRLGATSVLDYGCGQGSLAVAVRQAKVPGLRVSEYDPAIPDKSGQPTFADLIVCTDVLEHVEPEKIQAVLRHLRLLARRGVFVVVSLVETAKLLTDGRQAHILLRPADWWREQVAAAGFRILEEPQIKPDKQWVAVIG